MKKEKREKEIIKNKYELLIKQLKKERNTKRDDKDTYLTYECRQGNIEEVKKLIHRGMDINEKNKDGDTPLLIACKNGNIELIKCLLN